ncbi:MAG: AAA family ATPase [Enterococcus sp.]
MISEKYKAQLIHEVILLEHLSNENFELEKSIKEITETHDDDKILIFIKNLRTFTKQNDSISKELPKKELHIIELLYKYLGSDKVDQLFESLRQTSNVSLEQLIGELDTLVGLREVKQQVSDLMAFNQIQNLRTKNGLKKSDKTLHMAFLGNPGTAKTTVARIIGRMYKSIGLLSKGHFIEASRTDLIAEYQGQTANKVKKLIQKARGGVLFIDEAYSLTENSNGDSYGKESLTELTKALEDYRDDLVVIVAGYPDLMDSFFKSNPGLKSRFNTFIHFYDYSLEELLGIFKYLCDKNEYIVDDSTFDRVREYLQNEVENKSSDFSNGRMVRNLFDDIVMRQSKRLVNSGVVPTKENLMTFYSTDVPNKRVIENLNVV